MTDLAEIPIITEPAEQYLNQRQQLDYKSEREQCLRWLLSIGKNPDRGDGYAKGTIKTRSYRMDQFYRWVWDNAGGYTVNVSHEHADEWMRELAHTDHSMAHKANCQKSVKMLFKWRQRQRGDAQWEPTITFSDGANNNPQDYLTVDERRHIREAALKSGSVPSYNNLTPEERDRWKRYLSQRFEIKKEAVEPAHWDRANSWKIPSLVWTSLDAGLRPIEVGRAKRSWVDSTNDVLRIPKEDSAKNSDNWIVSLQEQTSSALRRWIAEQSAYPKYDDSEHLWLTREGNRYDSGSLRYLLQQLCEIAGIDTQYRKMSWYTIRHSLGTYMTREEDLAATQSQLRHQSVETTMKALV